MFGCTICGIPSRASSSTAADSLYVVQGLLGHLHARTTQRYAHLTRETLTDAAELVQEVVALPQFQRPTGPSAAKERLNSVPFCAS